MESTKMEKVFRPKDAIGAATTSTVITGGAGFLISAVQNTLSKQNVSGWGVFTKTGSTIALFGSGSW
jgi:hypothetical protein